MLGPNDNYDNGLRNEVRWNFPRRVHGTIARGKRHLAHGACLQRGLATTAIALVCRRILYCWQENARIVFIHHEQE
jgi:hypothetical protein